MKNLAFLAMVFALLLAGCLQGGQTQTSNGDAMEKASPEGAMIKEVTPSPDAMQKEASPTAIERKETEGEAMQKPGEAAGNSSQSGQAMMEYSGTVLAGSSAKLLDFNKKDFEAAKASNSLIVLYFYADWCPVCKEEFPKMQAAFNELGNENVVGFRVNYRDDFTDADEEALAREHGVPYQHTKVFLRNGERVLKSPEGWDKQRYLDEIGKALA